MKRFEIIIGLNRVLLDFVSVLGAWVLAYWIRPYTDLIPFVQYYFPAESLPHWRFFLQFDLQASFGLILLFALLGHYQIGKKWDWSQEIFKILFGVFLWGMLIVSYFSLVRHVHIFSRAMLLQALVFASILIFLLRLFLQWLAVFIWKKGWFAKKILLFGEGAYLEILKNKVSQVAPFKLVGIIKSQAFKQLEQQIVQQQPDEIWQVSAYANPQQSNYLRAVAAENHLDFRFVPSDLSLQFAKLNLEMIGQIPVMQPVQSNLGGWGRVAKRSFDFLTSLLLLILCLPFFALIAVLIKLDSRGPIFFVQERIGRKGRKFNVIKFRSMVFDAETQKQKLLQKSHRQDGPLFKIKNDPRITRIGKFLRRFSIDELPNLFNVFLGQMSLTGPRPHLPEEVDKFSAWQKRVLEVRPGITGLSQVSGRSDLYFEKEVELDLYFIQNWNFFLELKILLKTIVVVLSGKGAD